MNIHCFLGIFLLKSACLGYEAKLAEPQTSQEIAFLGNQVNMISKFQSTEFILILMEILQVCEVKFIITK